LGLVSLISQKLSDIGYQVDTKIGLSNYKLDIAIVHPDDPSRYILGIECDEHFFLSTPSTKERDVTRQQFLEKKGWIIERVWSKNWWLDSGKEIRRIQDKIEELRKNNDGSVLKDKINKKDKLEYDRISEKVFDYQVLKKEENIIKRIKDRESSNVERKSSFRYDINLKQLNPKVIEKIIAKTVQAFMNAEGGTLFIGVDDDGNILGLLEDYKTLDKGNSDKFELKLRQSLENYLNDKIVNELIQIDFHTIEEREICELNIKKSPKPIILTAEGKQEFYVRIGNSSKPYSFNEFYEYSKRRFQI